MLMELSWEQLHLGHWKDVLLVSRYDASVKLWRSAEQTCALVRNASFSSLSCKVMCRPLTLPGVCGAEYHVSA